ncbi:MAG: 1-deoxy-D-xylulose-5-phosphate reductoisomerase [candidate division Zixibacteria bacterium]|nr:1-deoxy-D-xylulose-5-phosphate reductoisomerase [candidate division Zixibacteria bacterium]
MAPTSISIIGSTGSIGRSTLAVVDRYPERLRVVGLATHQNVERLVEQVQTYRPEMVGICDDSRAGQLRASTSDETSHVVGESALIDVASFPDAETVVIAVVGFAGVRPTLAAIDAGHNVALANKETLITAGEIVMARARQRGVSLAPIDSEHSAIWQCLRAGERGEVRRIILTASGGPFRTLPLDQLDDITPEQALAHPTWNMGSRITIDSATMMNKGFEIIEAARLFDLESDQIDVVIHPQSLVHSMVEFRDGSIIAQLGATDMTLPIAYALFAPDRPPAAEGMPILDVTQMGQLTFEPPDPDRFPALALARRALEDGGTAPVVLNAADEVAVAAFLDGRLRFPEIARTVAEVLDQHTVVKQPTLEDIEAADRWAREIVNHHVANPYTNSGVT